MFKGKRIGCVIPARLGSSRFFQKVMQPIEGKPLFWWTYQAAKACGIFDFLIVAVDDSAVLEKAHSLHVPVMMTRMDHPSGTDRLIEVSESVAASIDVWVNWQADEPLVTRSMIESLLSSIDQPHAKIWTLRHPIESQEALHSCNVVKVVVGENDRALNFSRLHEQMVRPDKHVGLYAFAADILATIKHLPPSPREKSERLEQLRFLDAGIAICVHKTHSTTIGVDTEEDFVKVKEMIKGNSSDRV